MTGILSEGLVVVGDEIHILRRTAARVRYLSNIYSHGLQAGALATVAAYEHWVGDVNEARYPVQKVENEGSGV